MNNIDVKIEMLAKLIENDQIQGLKDISCYCKANVINCKVVVTKKRKYTYIDLGEGLHQSGKYMIDNSTEEIFGIKGYGQVNKNHYYGTLDTITGYFWGGYTFRMLKENRDVNFEELNSVEDEIIKIDNEQFEKEVINVNDKVELIDVEKENNKNDSKSFLEAKLEEDIKYLEENKDRIEENRKQWNYIIREVEHTIITNSIKNETIEYKKKGAFYVLTHKKNGKIIFTKLTNHTDSCMYITCMRDGDEYSNNWERELEDEFKNHNYDIKDLLGAFNKCGSITGDIQI